MQTSLSRHAKPRRFRLSKEDREKIEEAAFDIRMQLIETLRGTRYELEAKCSNCSRELKPTEIIGGFTQNPDDTMTSCPSCGHRFGAILTCASKGWRYPFICDIQTLSRLRGKEKIPSQELKEEDPAAYHSAIVHYGTLRHAFAKDGIVYTPTEVRDWRDGISPFLGRLSDFVIAQHIGVSSSTIGRIRRNHDILPYTLRRALKSLQEKVS